VRTATKMLDAARAYAERGWAVFPCQPKSKQPLTAHGFKDASTDLKQIRAWWTDCPEANVAIATGAVSSITVFDVDIKPWKDVHGDQSLLALLAEYGALPSTLYQRTWSGGLQYIFAHAPGVRNSTSKVGPHLDIRGDGGYVIVPPSIVEEDDRFGVYAWQNDAEVAPMPDWLLERVKSAGAEAAAAGSPLLPQTANLLRWPNSLLGGVEEGSRDDTCWRLVRHYATKRPPLSKDEVLRFMLIWAADCTPPFPEATVHEKVERVFAGIESRVLLELPLTDAGNAERMVVLFGDRFRWVTDAGEWLAWDSRRWAPGSLERVKGYALEAARMTQAAAVRLVGDAKLKRRIIGHALSGESAGGISNAVHVAKVLPAVWVDGRTLDSRPDLLNVANGTLDLKTFELRPHDPADQLTRTMAVPYEPEATAPLWRRFLDEVFCGRQDVIDYVQRAVGYTVTGSIEEQCFFLLHGAGANGKSTFVAVITALFADYATKLDQEAILASDRNRGRGPTPELVTLIGRRLAYVDEMEESRQLDEARVKALTGSERATGRALYQNMREWTNTAKLWLDLNHLPAFRGVDAGIERRPRVIPFDRRFEEHEQDKQLVQKLLAELPGILAWVIEGCRQWHKRGLDAPDVVSIATRRYRDDNNHLPIFMEEHYVKRAGAELQVGVLKEEYERWCGQRDEEALNYQRKVVPFLEQVWKLTRKRVHGGRFAWVGLTRAAEA
jgi:putative DNA primase/helicase